MGIELNSFRTAVNGDGKWLSVQSGDMSKVVGSAEKQVISVSDLAQAEESGDLNKAANNIYMRGQLLEGIRSSLSAMGQTKAAKDFFENAEKTLFGELKGKQYGVDTASQDLSIETARDLLEQLDSLMETNSNKPKPKKDALVEGMNENNISDVNDNNIINVNNRVKEEEIDLGGGDFNPFKRSDKDKDDFGLVPKELRSPGNVVTDDAKTVECISIGNGKFLKVPDLSNVNPKFSFKDLVAISNHGAGEVRLDLDGKLMRINEKIGNLTGSTREYTTEEDNAAVRLQVCACLLKAPDLRELPTASANKLKGILLSDDIRNLPLSKDEIKRVLDIATALRTNDSKLVEEMAKSLDAIRLVDRQIAEKCPLVSDLQRDVLFNVGHGLNVGKLAACLKLPETAVKGCRIDDVTPLAGGLDLRCTLTLKNGLGVTFLIGHRGELVNVKECRAGMEKLSPGDRTKCSALQMMTLGKLDGKMLAGSGILNIPVDQIDGFEIEAPRMAEDGRNVECDITRPDGVKDVIVIKRDGDICLKSLRDEVMELVKPFYFYSDQPVDAFHGADLHEVKVLVGILSDGAKNFDSIYGGTIDDGGILGPHKVNECALNMLCSVMSSVKSKLKTSGDQELVSAVWKELGLSGKPPRLGERGATAAFFKGFRDRIGEDLLGFYKLQGNEYAQAVLLTTDEYEQTTVSANLKYHKSIVNMTAPIIDCVGLPYKVKLAKGKGKWPLSFADFMVFPNCIPINQLDFSPGRYTGAKYSVNGELLYECKGVNDKSYGDFVSRLKQAGNNDLQVNKLSLFLNEAGLYLMTGFGGNVDSHDTYIDVLTDAIHQHDGNLHFRVKLPRRSFKEFHDVPKSINAGISNEMGNVCEVEGSGEYIVGDFAIRPNGELAVGNFRLTRPTAKPQSYWWTPTGKLKLKG